MEQMEFSSCRAACEALYDILPEHVRGSALAALRLLENCEQIEKSLLRLCGQVDPVFLYRAVPEPLWPELDSLLAAAGALLDGLCG